MQYATTNSLRKLRNEAIKGPAVTIYVPTIKSASPPHITENQIRLKNLIHRAAEMLKKRPDGGLLAKEICRRLDSLVGDTEFWTGQSEGLLICAADGVFELFHLPIDTEEYVAVDGHFHVAPILALLEADQDFYVLLVAKHQPALFKGTMYGLKDSGVKLPKTLEAGLRIDEMNLKSEQGRSAGTPNIGPSGAGFNGRGGAKNPAEEELARFLRMIDHIVCTKADRRLPLILAGVESEAAEYRALSKYPKILDGCICGNYTHENRNELFARARTVIYGSLTARQNEEAIDRFERVRGSNPARVALTADAAAEAAETGRIDTLLVGLSRVTTDTVRENDEAVLEIAFPENEEVNYFVNNIALQAGNTSSRILNIPREDMPEGAPVLAILRY